jgi:hypothetical protein
MPGAFPDPSKERMTASAAKSGHSQPPFCLSRWGRFQDADEGANYEYICKRAGISVLSALAFDQGFA